MLKPPLVYVAVMADAGWRLLQLFFLYYYVLVSKQQTVYYLIYPLIAYELAYGVAINQGAS